MIVLVLTSEEGATIQQRLPRGRLRDYVGGCLVTDQRLPAPTPAIVVARPPLHIEEHIFDDELADAMWAAMVAVLERRGTQPTAPVYSSPTVDAPCPQCGQREYVRAIRNALGRPLWFRCSACGELGWDAPAAASEDRV